MTKVSVEDRLDAFDVLSRYSIYVDEGEVEKFLSLWTEDGVFAGTTPVPLRGHEQLAVLPKGTLGSGSRHYASNILCEYGDTTDELVVDCYSLVISWLQGASFIGNAVCRFHLVRRGDGWKIRANRLRLQPGPGIPTDSFPQGYPIPADRPTVFPEA